MQPLIYQVIHHTADPGDQPKQTYYYIFIGPRSSNVRKALKERRNTDLLASEFGDNWQDILQWQRPRRTTKYIYQWIYPDDNLHMVKYKIVSNLRAPVPLEWLYLYVHDFNVNQLQVPMQLGYSFVTKETQQLLDFQKKDPYFILHTDIDWANPPSYLYQEHFIDKQGNPLDDYQLNDLQGMLMLTVHPSEPPENSSASYKQLYVVDFCSYVFYLQRQLTIANDNYIKYGFIPKYWPYLFKDRSQYDIAFSNCLVSDQLKEEVPPIDQRIIQESDRQVELIRHWQTGPFNMTSAIVEVIVHVNYNYNYSKSDSSGENAFLDLNAIFHNYPLSAEVPFARYYSPEDNYNVFKFYRGIKELVPYKQSKSWIRSSINYRSKGLTYRLRINSPDDVNIYSIVTLYADGRIEMKSSWEESYQATMKDVYHSIRRLRQWVEEINQLQMTLPGISRTIGIPLPNDQLVDNTNIISINMISTSNITPTQINIDDLLAVATYFNHYVSITTKNIEQVRDPET